MDTNGKRWQKYNVHDVTLIEGYGCLWQFFAETELKLVPSGILPNSSPA